MNAPSDYKSCTVEALAHYHCERLVLRAEPRNDPDPSNVWHSVSFADVTYRRTNKLSNVKEHFGQWGVGLKAIPLWVHGGNGPAVAYSYDALNAFWTDEAKKSLPDLGPGTPDEGAFSRFWSLKYQTDTPPEVKSNLAELILTDLKVPRRPSVLGELDQVGEQPAAPLSPMQPARICTERLPDGEQYKVAMRFASICAFREHLPDEYSAIYFGWGDMTRESTAVWSEKENALVGGYAIAVTETVAWIVGISGAPDNNTERRRYTVDLLVNMAIRDVFHRYPTVTALWLGGGMCRSTRVSFYRRLEAWMAPSYRSGLSVICADHKDAGVRRAFARRVFDAFYAETHDGTVVRRESSWKFTARKGETSATLHQGMNMSGDDSKQLISFWRNVGASTDSNATVTNVSAAGSFVGQCPQNLLEGNESSPPETLKAEMDEAAHAGPVTVVIGRPGTEPWIIQEMAVYLTMSPAEIVADRLLDHVQKPDENHPRHIAVRGE